MPSSPRPLSAEASQDEIKSREDTEITGSRPEELRNASPRGSPAQMSVETLGRRELREEELAEKWGGVEVQQQEGVAGQKERLRQPTMGDERSLIVAFGADDPEDKAAIGQSSHRDSMQLEIDKHHFRLSGIRARQLADARQGQRSTE